MIAFLANHVRKVKLYRAGACIGSIFRWHGRVKHRGNMWKQAGDVAHIYLRNGTVQKVIQKSK